MSLVIRVGSRHCPKGHLRRPDEGGRHEREIDFEPVREVHSPSRCVTSLFAVRFGWI